MLVAANIFQPLISIFEAVLKFFHNSAGVSWGWSIVLLTVVIRAVLIPLTLKQFHSMQRLQRLQPQMKAIQNKYKDDKQRQQQELMKFYKENQVNPLGSCLPLAAQLPVFISLFYMLRQDLRINICPQVQHAFQAIHGAGHTTPCGPHQGAGFLFITDLTNTAKGATLIVLVLLYIGTQIASTLMMSTSTMEPTQRRLMLLLPLFFVIFIINFPSGLIVYWITTNAWTILQQYVVKKRIGPMGPPVEATAAAAGGGGGTRGAGAGAARAGEAAANGSDSGGGLAGLLRGRTKTAEEPAPVGAGARSRRQTAPPPPPRKKKKRSGRRR
jgi:YidC/Oxa1 family membrane protein insertase